LFVGGDSDSVDWAILKNQFLVFVTYNFLKQSIRQACRISSLSNTKRETGDLARALNTGQKRVCARKPIFLSWNGQASF
jgi:hypothetical protein